MWASSVLSVNFIVIMFTTIIVQVNQRLRFCFYYKGRGVKHEKLLATLSIGPLGDIWGVTG